MDSGRRGLTFVILTAMVLFSCFPALAADEPVGWAVFADGGKVYRCAVEGSPEQLYDGSVQNARWSADGRYIYFIKTNGDIWAMYNDGP